MKRSIFEDNLAIGVTGACTYVSKPWARSLTFTGWRLQQEDEILVLAVVLAIDLTERAEKRDE